MLLLHLIVVSFAIVSCNAVDYCSNTLQCQRPSHVACNNPLYNGGWGSECNSPSLISMTESMKKRILDYHNGCRNQTASGNLPNYSSATRMATMRWDDELAKFAETNVRSCHYGHDNCTNTENWIAVGQNIAVQTVFGNPPQTSNEDKVISLATLWFANEYPNGQYFGYMKFINSFQMPPAGDTRQIGHFTQIVSDDCLAVGCACSESTVSSGGRQTYFVCNYSRTNILGAAVYKAGPTASDCETGRSEDFSALCSGDEDYEAWYYLN